jgi:hypothetical protein
MMIGYDIYDRFTMEHFSFCQSMILTISFFFARDSINNQMYLTMTPAHFMQTRRTKSIFKTSF